MSGNDTKRGIMLMSLTMLIFASQDGISRYLAGEYNVLMVVMIRYWFFAAFVLTVSAKRAGSIANAARTKQPVLQIFRGVLLALEVCILVAAFTLLGLIESMAIFISYPLIVAALSGPILGEQVGLYRWTAIGIGFIGVLVILQPGGGVFSPYALLAVVSAMMFALYTLLTRYVARKDTAATSFFWTGVAGAVAISAIGIWFWEPMARGDWLWMLALCISGATGHYLLIKTYEVAEASAVQPFAYLQLVFVSVIGLFVFNEDLRTNVVVGAGLVIAAGIFTLWRARRATA
ncbi:EamA domain-containing membrane protein RarD [Litoreibacter ascidiaceicola]|uniref:EamA domain-containing membrane protein RarD n=1 Tax=Litoreibacter ascidiaceicola TaxID=1486859 RepID=A0A1M5ANC6_9RHOB|nr:DMT family transporter [Litoreibacter ascidiaceicola]SHF31666.1 EamA domain-containing membrane protein RarD [Litoreibacter ascidiaceicola]